ncbi:hypothetical protein [Zavarzinella formosa]|uniref:hypothetical protein n=1 Tax=Zavarzinella formosa TaxID=360055 RepID=UPI0004980462|nr:hypothetical protein [Zavarzinella formosa]
MYRLNLSACLAQAGDFSAAYRVAESIQVAGIDCPHWLQLMLPVFAWAGDDHRERECRIALDYLREDPDHDGPCSRCE